ncbi:hypothetical protein BB558_006639, partial [Smittium angustum]
NNDKVNQLVNQLLDFENLDQKYTSSRDNFQPFSFTSIQEFNTRFGTDSEHPSTQGHSGTANKNEISYMGAYKHLGELEPVFLLLLVLMIVALEMGTNATTQLVPVVAVPRKSISPFSSVAAANVTDLILSPLQKYTILLSVSLLY